MSRNTKCQSFFVVLTFISFLVWLVFTFLNVAQVGGLFYSSQAFLNLKYYQESMPGDTVISIAWVIVHLWTLAAVTYIFVSMFLEDRKSPVHVQPTLMSNSFLITLCVVFSVMIGWLFSFDRELLGLSLALLIIATVACYCALGILAKRTYDNIYLESRETRPMLWLVRIVLLNGLALLATWLTVLTCFSITDVLLYHGSFGVPLALEIGIFPVEDASSVVLAFLLANIILWFTLDLVVFENYARYIFSIYPLLILISAGLVGKLRTPFTYRNLVFSAVILAFCLFAFVFRIIFFLCRWRSRRKAVQ